MKKTEITFLICVFSAAALFCVASVRETLPLLPGAPAPTAAVSATAGQARDVDLDKLRRMLRQHELSSHEAMYYKTMPTEPAGRSEQE
jgi:hypothetical protein